MNRLLWFALFLFSCQSGSNAGPTYLIGKWEVTRADVFTPDNNDALEIETTSLARSVRYEFQPDFIYIIRSKVSPEGKVGHWKFDPFARQLEMTTDGETTFATLDKNSDTEISLTSTLPGLGKITMHCKKKENP